MNDKLLRCLGFCEMQHILNKKCRFVLPSKSGMTHLAIDINTNAVRFVKLNGKFVVSERAFAFQEKQDYRYKAQLEEFWKQTEWKETDFEKATLSWSEKQNVVVPANVFNESDKNAIFNLAYGTSVSLDEVDYNRLPMQNMVNVFFIPAWVKSFFVLRFPRIVLQHEATHLIRGVFEGPTFKLKSTLVLHHEHLVLMVVKENNLKFYSSFDYATLEDVVYYFSYSMQQLGLNEQPNELEITNGAGSEVDLAALQALIEKVQGNNCTVKQSHSLVEKYQSTCV